MSVTLTTIGSPPSSIMLPNPILADVDQLNIKTKFKMSMTGVVYSYLNTPATTKFLLNFINIPTDTISLLITFLGKAASKLCSYYDYDGNSYQVKIVNNPFERSTDGRAACVDPADFNERNNFVLELEVVP